MLRTEIRLYESTVTLIAYQHHLRNIAATDAAVRQGGANANRIAAALDVDPRTVHRYFAFLRELGAPLMWSDAAQEYRYKRRWRFAAALLRWLDPACTARESRP